MTTKSSSPAGDDRPKMVVDCRECAFRETVPIGAETSPADTVVDHGRSTGHVLSVSHVQA